MCLLCASKCYEWTEADTKILVDAENWEAKIVETTECYYVSLIPITVVCLNV